MKTPYVSELEPNQLVQGVFLVQHKEIRQKKTGEPYLSLTLADRTGDVDAKMWDNVPEVMDTFERDCFLQGQRHGAVFPEQAAAHHLPLAAAGGDPRSISPISCPPPTRSRRNVRGAQGLDRVDDQPALEGAARNHLRRRSRRAGVPHGACREVHSSRLDRRVDRARALASASSPKFTAAHYPDIDFDLLLTGVILHDIGKIPELTYARSLGYSTEGQLIGHISIGVRMVEDALRSFPASPLAARLGRAHDPEPPWLAGIRIAQGAHVSGGDAAASDRQPGFEDGSACARTSRRTARPPACGPDIIRRSSALFLKKQQYLVEPEEQAAPPAPLLTAAALLAKAPPSSAFAAKLQGALKSES